MSMNPQDIYIWADGFWCFREEYFPEMLRDEHYKVIEANTPEWDFIANARHAIWPR